MIQHIVLLKWKPGTTDAQIDAAFADARQLVDEIDSVERVTLGRNLGQTDHGFTHAIIVKLDDMLHARRMTLTEVAEKVDITLANLSILKTGKAKAIRFSTLDAICRQLGCQPGDLLAFDGEGAPAEEKLANAL